MKVPFIKKFTMIHKLMLAGTSIGFLVAAYFYYALFIYVKYGPIVEIKQGKLQGRILESRNGTEYFAYLGIPYAKPPVGALRFQPPQDAAHWNDTRDATHFGSACVHLEFFVTGLVFGSEDCLFLNVFSPKLKDNETEKLYPVMVYIHGGLFHVGSGDRVGGAYFMDEEVVLVTINYRLGVFGFLNTGDDVVRGNMGLKDQTKALRWIQDNIETFGGDASRVTIFGESAGGACVAHHMLSPSSKGLFHSAISQSGTSINEWAVNRTPREQAERFANKFACPVDSSKEMVDCLMKLDQYAMVEAHSELLDILYHKRIMAFVPTIETVKNEDAFLTDEPLELLKSGKFNRVPWITGANSEDGLMFSAIIAASQTKMNDANDNWNDWSSTILHFDRNDTIAQKIRQYYFEGEATINSTEYLSVYADMIGDRLFKVDASNAADLTRRYVPTYLYLYSYHGQISLTEITPLTEGGIHVYINLAWYAFKRILREYLLREDMTRPAASHADELMLLFPQDFIPRYQYIGQKDYEMSVDFVKLWVSFATNPNGNMELRGVPWPSINSGLENQRFLNISSSPDVIDHPYIETVKFWNSLNLPLR